MMVPRSSTARSRKGFRSSSQERLPSTKLDQLTKALNVLCDQLKKAVSSKSPNTEFRSSPEALNPTNEILRYCRQHSVQVPLSLATGPASQLNIGGYDLCSSLSAEAFGVLLQIILQAEYSLDGERSLHLLAGSLYYDLTTGRDSLLGRKSTIGEHLLQVLDFFTITDNHRRMRNWAGTLCLQLIQDCEKNSKRIEMGAEGLKRRLGYLILREKDEITRLICGNLTRMILDTTNLEQKDLWPIDTDSALYANFPEIGNSWQSRFQQFIDEAKQLMVPISPNTESAATLYFGMDVITFPTRDFASEGHNVVISLESESINFWAPSAKDTNKFEQSLEIKLKTIHSMNMSSCLTPQKTSKIQLDISSLPSEMCNIDSKLHQITGLTMLMNSHDAQEIERSLTEYNPQLKAILGGQTSEEIGDHNKHFQATHQSPQSSQSQDPIKLGATSKFNEVEAKMYSGVGSTVLSTKVHPGIQTQTGPVTIVSKISQILDAQQFKLNQQAELVDLSNEASLLTRPAKPKRQTLTKLKAKPPLRRSQISGESPIQSKPPSSEPMNLPFKAHTNVHKSLLPEQNMGSKMTKLGPNFPHASKPVLRGALVVSKENVQAAASLLERSSNLILTLEDQSNFKDHEDSDMFTSPEPCDSSESRREIREEMQASTNPHTKMTRGQISVYRSATVKNDVKNISKVNESGNSKVVDEDDVPAGVEADGRELLEFKINKKMLMPEAPAYAFEIPDDPLAAKSLVCTKPVSRSSRKPTLRPITTTIATTKEASRVSAERFNKRKSAPGIIQEGAQTKRLQRSVTVGAGKKSSAIDKIGNNIEENEETVKSFELNFAGTEIDANKISYVLQTTGDQESLVKSCHQVNKIVQQQQQEQVLASVLCDQDSPGAGIEEFYDATRLKTSETLKDVGEREKPVIVGLKRSTKSLGDLASTMNELFSLPEFEVTEKSMPEVSQEDILPLGTNQKRKALDNVGSPAKRQREIKKPSKNDDSPVGHSPRNATEKLENDKNVWEVLEMKTSSSPLASSLHLQACLTEPQVVNGNTPVPGELVNDHLTRKQQIISFGVHGARNQGLSSAVGRSTDRNIQTTPFAAIPETMAQNPYIDQQPSLVSRRSSGISRPYSQKSFVNKNGSPIGSFHVDHISKAERKLLDNYSFESGLEASQSPSPHAPLFGERLTLLGIRKARPSSPAKFVSQYVPHQKTANGWYEGVGTSEIVTEGNVLADPFVEKSILSSNNNFTKRLVVDVAPKQTTLLQQLPNMPLRRMKYNTILIHKNFDQASDMARRVKPESLIKRESKNFAAAAALNTEDALLRLEDMSSSNSFHGEIIGRTFSDSTLASRSEPASDTCSRSAESKIGQVEGGWKVALKPHYSNLAETINRIADEVIVRLSKEEDVVGLLVDQYKEGGTKILDNSTQIRDDLKVHMKIEINEKRLMLAQFYSSAKDSIERRKHDIARSPITNMEHQWEEAQESIQAKLSNCRQISS